MRAQAILEAAQGERLRHEANESIGLGFNVGQQTLTLVVRQLETVNT